MQAHDVTVLAELPGRVSGPFARKPALIFDGHMLTYQELEERSNAVADCLVRSKMGPGDRVALLARDSAISVPILFGAAKARAVWVGINWRLAFEEIAAIIVDARPRMIFVDAEFASTLERALEKTDVRPTVVSLSPDVPGDQRAVGIEVWMKGASPAPRELHHDPDEAVVQIYTSGTTGQPKGVQLSSRSFFAIAQAMAAQDQPFLGWTSTDVSLLFVPTFYVAGLWWLIRGLALGSSNVVLKAFDPRLILKAIPEHRVTKMGMVPAMMQMLLGEPGFKDADLSSLRTILYGGGPIAVPSLQRALDALPCDFCQAYGMTETGNIAACLGPQDHRGGDQARLLSAGRPLPGVKLRIVRRDGSEAAPEERGEIAILSPARMIGYWNRPEVTAATLVDGWVMTGDIGYLDAQGYLYICDRLKDMIICAGENIYPAEIEQTLRLHPGVADAAVIGIPHEMWGESIMAFVVARPSTALTPRDVVLHMRAHLADYKAPSEVRIVDQLPRNASGKVLKTALRAPFWRNRVRGIN